MNWHEVIDERNFEMDQIIASKLRENPCHLASAETWIEGRLADPNYSESAKDALMEWREVMRKKGLAGVLELLSERSEEADRMRQSSPFAFLMPEDERKRILEKYEARRPRAHPARF